MRRSVAPSVWGEQLVRDDEWSGRFGSVGERLRGRSLTGRQMRVLRSMRSRTRIERSAVRVRVGDL
jgi:hypothetical protein